MKRLGNLEIKTLLKKPRVKVHRVKSFSNCLKTNLGISLFILFGREAQSIIALNMLCCTPFSCSLVRELEAQK